MILKTILRLERDQRRLKRSPTGAMVPLEDRDGLQRVVWSIGIPPRSTPPVDEASDQEACDRVLDALEAISPIQSGLIVLVHAYDMTIGEAARELHLEAREASRLLHMAIETVRRSLGIERLPGRCRPHHV